MPYTYEYPRPAVAVDVVLFSIKEGDLKILFIKRKNLPFEGKWAIPGGFIEIDEPLEDGARREMEEETGIKDFYMEQLYTFGNPKRDPRGRIISVNYIGILSPQSRVEPKAADDAREVAWFSAYSLPPLAFDHEGIIDVAHSRLRERLRFTPLGFKFLQKEFILSELQGVYEVVFGKKIDRRRFRRKILSLGILKELKKKRKTVPKQARIYILDTRVSPNLCFSPFIG